MKKNIILELNMEDCLENEDDVFNEVNELEKNKKIGVFDYDIRFFYECKREEILQTFFKIFGYNSLEEVKKAIANKTLDKELVENKLNNVQFLNETSFCDNRCLIYDILDKE